MLFDEASILVKNLRGKGTERRRNYPCGLSNDGEVEKAYLLVVRAQSFIFKKVLGLILLLIC